MLPSFFAVPVSSLAHRCSSLSSFKSAFNDSSAGWPSVSGTPAGSEPGTTWPRLDSTHCEGMPHCTPRSCDCMSGACLQRVFTHQPATQTNARNSIRCVPSHISKPPAAFPVPSERRSDLRSVRPQRPRNPHHRTSKRILALESGGWLVIVFVRVCTLDTIGRRLAMDR